MAEINISQEKTNHSNSTEADMTLDEMLKDIEEIQKANNKIQNKCKNTITYTKNRILLWNSMGMVALHQVPEHYLYLRATGILNQKDLIKFTQWAFDSYVNYLQLQYHSKFSEYGFDIEAYCNVVNEIQQAYDHISPYVDKLYKFDDVSIYDKLMYVFVHIKQQKENEKMSKKMKH